MSTLRALIRSISFFIVTIVLYAIYLIGRGITLVLNKNASSWRIYIVRLWAQAIAWIIQLDISIEGTPPKPPFLLVSNHLSYLDILPFFIASDCVFVAKNEIKSWPMLGTMAKGINIIFIDRQAKRDIPRVNRLIENNITEHQGIVIFPEGTTTKGNQVKEFNSSLLHYAASRNFPVTYSSISYDTERPDKPAHEWVCWYGDMTFADHFFNLLKLPSIKANVKFGETQVQHNNRKELAKHLHKRVKQQFIPTVSVKRNTYG